MSYDSTEVWRDWWQSAEDQYSVAEELFRGAHSNHAVFHALMARELASKAVRMAPALIRHLHGVTFGELKGYTIGQLGGRPRKRAHDGAKQLDAPWLPQEAETTVIRRIQAVETELGVNSLYEASRYPDRWPDGRGIPHQLLKDDDALLVLKAVADFLKECRDHLSNRERLERLMWTAVLLGAERATVDHISIIASPATSSRTNRWLSFLHGSPSAAVS